MSAGGVNPPVMNLANVLLPVPECPVSTKKSPFFRERLRSLKRGSGLSAYHRLRFLISINEIDFSMDETTKR